MGPYTLGTVGAGVLEPKSTENFQALSVICSAKDVVVCQFTNSSSRVAWGEWFGLMGRRGKENNSPLRNIPVCLARPGAWRSKRLDTFQVDFPETEKELIYGLKEWTVLPRL